MTVISASVVRPKPGKTRQAIELSQHASEILVGLGASTPRLLQATAAGEQAGTQIFTVEFPSFQAWGSFLDKIAEDRDVALITDQLEAENSPTQLMSQALLVELNLGRANPKVGIGTVVQAYAAAIQPGKFEDVLSLAAQAFDFVEGYGATNTRLFLTHSGGAQTDQVVVSWEAPSMATMGKIQDGYYNDPDGQKLQETMLGTKSPITQVSSGIYQVIY